MTLRSRFCYEISRRLMKPPAERTVRYDSYTAWRTNSLSSSLDAFSDDHLIGKDVLDFGCGDGQLSIFLAGAKRPRSVVGVDLNAAAIERARANLSTLPAELSGVVRFAVGQIDRLPVPDSSIDALLAFDCLEHVMSPEQIMAEWFRVLRPGGRCLVEWYPFKGPWGPHMEALIPIPWAHVLFGERAMFRAAAMIYDHPDFVPRHWDLDEQGRKKPNKWAAWSSFREQAYVNELSLDSFIRMTESVGFLAPRLKRRSFGGSALRRLAGRSLMGLPLIGEYFVSFVEVELERPV